MDKDPIIEIGIDEQGRLYIVPTMAKFPYIYREAKQVNWNDEKKCLHSPKPKDWNYLKWYMQLISAAKEQSYELTITTKTRWVNVPEELKLEIEP